MPRKKDELILDLHYRLRESHLEKMSSKYNLEKDKIQKLFKTHFESLKNDKKLMDYLANALFEYTLNDLGLIKNETSQSKTEINNLNEISDMLKDALSKNNELHFRVLENLLVENCEFTQSQINVVLDKMEEKNYSNENSSDLNVNERLNRLKSKREDIKEKEIKITQEELEKNMDMIDF